MEHEGSLPHSQEFYSIKMLTFHKILVLRQNNVNTAISFFILIC